MSNDTSLNTNLFYLIIVLTGVLGGVADILIYMWAKTGGLFLLIVSSLAWMVSLFLFGYLLKFDQKTLTFLFLVSTILHVVLVLAYDFIFLGSNFSKSEWIGIILSIIGICLLEYGKSHPEDQLPKINKSVNAISKT